MTTEFERFRRMLGRIPVLLDSSSGNRSPFADLVVKFAS